MEQHLNLFYGLSFLTAVIAFAYAAYLYLWVKKQQVVNKRIAEVAQLIKEGANTFMRREYKVLAIFSAVVAALIFLLLLDPQVQVCRIGKGDDRGQEGEDIEETEVLFHKKTLYQ